MHTDSSASATYLASRSASEWTTTVLMPSSRHARWMRSAISPRLAIRILSNSFSGLTATWGAALHDHEQRLTEFDRLSVLGEDRLHRAGGVGLDLVHQLHRLDDAERVALRDRVADFDERLGARRRRPIERAHHRALDDVAFRRRRWRGLAAHVVRAAGRRDRRGHRRGQHHRLR